MARELLLLAVLSPQAVATWMDLLVSEMTHLTTRWARMMALLMAGTN